MSEAIALATLVVAAIGVYIQYLGVMPTKKRPAAKVEETMPKQED